jgi:hypothetical protein
MDRPSAEALRRSCIELLIEAYEEAGIAGLCHEGRFELAVDRLRATPIEDLTRRAVPPR